MEHAKCILVVDLRVQITKEEYELAEETARRLVADGIINPGNQWFVFTSRKTFDNFLAMGRNSLN